MIKKKRLFYLICLIPLVWVGVEYGWEFAFACVAGFFLLLGALKLWKMTASTHRLAELQALQARYGWDAQAAALPRREAPPQQWNFVVLGDTRNNVPISRALYKRARTEEPDMLFHTGDIVRSGTPRELLDNHIRVIEEEGLTFPVFCVPGNHERGPLYNFAAYKALYGSERFSFVHESCIFVGFNNSGKRGVRDEDLEFLEAALKPPSKHSFVFLHIPPAFFEAAFVLDSHRRGFKKNAGRFHEIVCEYNVDEVFMAHIHGYASAVIDGVRYTLTGGGGAPLSPRLARQDRHYHLLNMRITQDGIERELCVYRDGDWIKRDVAT